MAVNIDALAQQAATQGQQMLNSDLGNQSQYKSQYQNYVNQANAANQNVKNYTDYMQGAGSAGNQYGGELTKQLGDLGYNTDEMNSARGNLNHAMGAESAYNDFANTAASKFGMNAGGFAAANSGALGGLNNNIASNQSVVNNLEDLYKTAQTGANQFTGNVVQGEQNTLGGLQDVYTNASSSRDQAASMMNFYGQLAQQQGGLNAQQQQSFAQAKQLYAAAQQAIAQSAWLMSQTSGQNLQNQMTQNAMGSQAYKNYLQYGSPSGPAPAGPAAPAATSKSAPSTFSLGNIFSTLNNEGPTNMLKEGIAHYL
jgi:hypothetical protein